MELISEKERKKCEQVFQSLSHNSDFISVDNMLIIARAVSEDPCFPEQDIYEIIDDDMVSNTRRLDIDHFFKLIEEIKRRQNQSNEEDTKLAYVAMGGGENKAGYVDAESLIKVIKVEFEMTIDIEALIKEIDEDDSGKVEYVEFN